MKLSIKNFAKIKEADIIIDGITVLAGENNTGKSTVGKILFSVFNALSNIDKKVFEERLKEIESTNRAIIESNISIFKIPRNVLAHRSLNIARRINSQIKKGLDTGLLSIDEEIFEIVKQTMDTLSGSDTDIETCDWLETAKEISKNTNEIINLPEENVQLELISKYFNEVFDFQIKSLFPDESVEATVALEIKGKKEELQFVNNFCQRVVDDVKIMHKAIYIDNPFILDELSKYNDLNPMNKQLKRLLTDKVGDEVLDGIIETVRAKEKLSDVYKALQNVVEGEISSNSGDGKYYYKNGDLNEPISIQNLSTGMKSFVILKMLLEKGCLKEKDVLILDEPEIHLHPQWQIAYAELIVLLQKHFDLSVIVTTHSPYFVDAINLFSCKYGTDNKVNYYLSSNEGKTVKMDCVTNEIDLIYKKMASPIQILDTLRYELNNN